MSQIFHRSTNAFARFTIFGGIFIVASFVFLIMMIDRSLFVTRQGQSFDQPVPFSHDHHVGEIGIDCRYCHITVERASFAGIPEPEICMNCHKVLFSDAPMLEPIRRSFETGEPVEWTRVYDLPDFVYFDHSIHVAKGISCVSCHGRVDKMPMTVKATSLKMDFCLECHFDPVKNVRPRDKVFDLAWQPGKDFSEEQIRLVHELNVQSKVDCSTCHR